MYDLIERFFYPRRYAVPSVFHIQPSRYSAVRRLVEDDHPTAEKTDSAWLDRLELRSSDCVIDLLESRGFQKQHGRVTALFVDGRCGLIHSFEVASRPIKDPEKTVAEILAEASNCHADGIILATNDLEEKMASSSRWNKLVSDLYHKGEATEIFLLDHFVLTAQGWSRMFTFTTSVSS